MLPKTLALVDDDLDYAAFLAEHLRGRGIEVAVFGDSNDLLTNPRAFDYGFYLVDLMLPGLDGMTTIGLLRRRTAAGVLVVSGKVAPDAFRDALGGGADMYLTKPVQFEQIDVAIDAVQRRIAESSTAAQAWLLHVKSRQLAAPTGERVNLSDWDFTLMQMFAAANGDVVSRAAICSRLADVSGTVAEVDLNATIYRLRRRVERAVSVAMPLQSKSKVGYVFAVPLKLC
ncbi:response regulator transcription factor [Rhizobacter sp. Root404]|uniref:response regulator transcription factor n=1 Tax=Rhizobacter sp. Root404 TaxID=1736528 RepID=UPI0006F45FCD|nr:response regulator transcription factor [Rhizobacter sp. Root404]KQW37956.1 transcriptional regulator [Rhizobacter sp. Root404]